MKIADFCFPEGIKLLGLKRSNSGSNLNELMFSKKYLRDNKHSFVFRLKAEHVIYGICIFRDEIVDVRIQKLTTSFFFLSNKNLFFFISKKKAYAKFCC